MENSATPKLEPFSTSVSQSNESSSFKRTLSDTVEESKLEAAQKLAQVAAKISPNKANGDKESISTEEAQRRTDELIQQMLQEDQRNGDTYYDEDEQYYDEEDLPDEHK